ncbi:hypothetical protein ACFLRN_10585, partial [Thermoproteota archaeon]
MTNLGIILISTMFFIALLIVKRPLIQWYKGFRRWIWHRRLIWKIERNLTKTSIDPDKFLS